MVDYLQQLHPFYVSALERLPQYDALELTEAIVHIINAVPTEQLLPTMQSFCLPIAQKLHTVAGATTGDKAQTVKELECT